MATLQLLNINGKNSGEINLNDTVFGATLNMDLLHNALVRQLANARSGSANTKTRAQVSGGGRKPWRQKGTGRARAGSIRSPLWEGGGVIFGPKPRDFSREMPKKMRQRALACALSAKKESIVLVDDLSSLNQGKTKEIATLLNNLKVAGTKVLLVVNVSNPESVQVKRAARNIALLKVVSDDDLSVKDLLSCNSIVMSKAAIEAIEKRLKATETDTNKKGEQRKSVKPLEKKPVKAAGKEPVKAVGTKPATAAEKKPIQAEAKSKQKSTTSNLKARKKEE